MSLENLLKKAWPYYQMESTRSSKNNAGRVILNLKIDDFDGFFQRVPEKQSILAEYVKKLSYLLIGFNKKRGFCRSGKSFNSIPAFEVCQLFAEPFSIITA